VNDIDNEIRIQRNIIRFADESIENLLWSIREMETVTIPRMRAEIEEYARQMDTARANIDAMEEEA
jgi:hypothetical protein